MAKVLVLNASYEPLNITSWRRAAVLLIKGKAEQIEHNGKLIYSDFNLPTVIRLRHFVRVPYKEIPLTRRNILHRDSHRRWRHLGKHGYSLRPLQRPQRQPHAARSAYVIVPSTA